MKAMPRYTDLDNAISEIKDIADILINYGEERYSEAYIQGILNAVKVLRELPTADVQPVVHGKWEEVYDINSQDYNSDNNWWLRCSYCRSYTKISFKKQRFDYCPDCGARMDGGTE